MQFYKSNDVTSYLYPLLLSAPSTSTTWHPRRRNVATVNLPSASAASPDRELVENSTRRMAATWRPANLYHSSRRRRSIKINRPMKWKYCTQDGGWGRGAIVHRNCGLINVVFLRRAAQGSSSLAFYTMLRPGGGGENKFDVVVSVIQINRFHLRRVSMKTITFSRVYHAGAGSPNSRFSSTVGEGLRCGEGYEVK